MQFLRGLLCFAGRRTTGRCCDRPGPLGGVIRVPVRTGDDRPAVLSDVDSPALGEEIRWVVGGIWDDRARAAGMAPVKNSPVDPLLRLLQSLDGEPLTLLGRETWGEPALDLLDEIVGDQLLTSVGDALSRVSGSRRSRIRLASRQHSATVFDHPGGR